MDKEIERFPWFDTVEFEGTRQTIWKYKRAIEDHKFILVGVTIASVGLGDGAQLNFQIYDGHVYSHWGSFPAIFDQSTLGLASLNPFIVNNSIDLHNWECKEFTMSMHAQWETANKQFNATVWYYQIPMTKAERFEYAVKQPRYKYRHGSAITLDRYEE